MQVLEEKKNWRAIKSCSFNQAASSLIFIFKWGHSMWYPFFFYYQLLKNFVAVGSHVTTTTQ